MRAITLWQPWATWVQRGWKTIEARRHTRFATLKGQRIAIHAARRVDEHAWRIAGPWLPRVAGDAWRTAPNILGAVICTVYVADARWLTAGDARAALCPCSRVGMCPHLFGLVFEDVIPMVPVYCPGHQGAWEWEAPQ
jgi:hypothetical protein